MVFLSIKRDIYVKGLTVKDQVYELFLLLSAAAIYLLPLHYNNFKKYLKMQ